MITPLNIDQAIIRIRAYATAKGWGPNRYAAVAGLNEATVRPFDKPGWNPTADTLRKLEAVIPAGWQPGDAVDDPAATANPSSTADRHDGDGKEAA